MADTILYKVKQALRISEDTLDFDDELNDLIGATLLDMGIIGITHTDLDETGVLKDKLIIRAVITYVKMNFGTIKSDEYNRLKQSYDEQKAQLQISSKYKETLADG